MVKHFPSTHKAPWPMFMITKMINNKNKGHKNITISYDGQRVYLHLTRLTVFHSRLIFWYSSKTILSRHRSFSFILRNLCIQKTFKYKLIISDFHFNNIWWSSSTPKSSINKKDQESRYAVSPLQHLMPNLWSIKPRPCFFNNTLIFTHNSYWGSSLFEIVLGLFLSLNFTFLSFSFFLSSFGDRVSL